MSLYKFLFLPDLLLGYLVGVVGNQFSHLAHHVVGQLLLYELAVDAHDDQPYHNDRYDCD